MKSIIVVLFLTYCFVGYGQIINFPDPNFKNALVNTKCVDENGDGTPDADADLNDDGEIDESEAIKILGLYVVGYPINSLERIELFKNLKQLKCSQLQLKKLNVSNLMKLKELNCEMNQINYLCVTGLANLAILNCQDNKLNSINTAGLVNLETLNCSYNLITFLDVKRLTKLKELSCYSNHILYLNVQGMKNLIKLNFSYNKISSICLQGLEKLEGLYCERNRLTILNLHGLSKLKYLVCSENQLLYLNIKGINFETFPNFEKNACLSNICCDEKTITLIKDIVKSNGQNCDINSENCITNIMCD